jgi:hypothetical protein
MRPDPVKTDADWKILYFTAESGGEYQEDDDGEFPSFSPPLKHLRQNQELMPRVHCTGGEYEEEDDGEFPSPPPPEHLAKLSMEAQFKV